MLRAVLLAVLVFPSHQQTPPSPCPNVFSYEPPGTEPGRWYGVVNLSTDSILHSVWVNIVLDSKADILGNWVGDVTTSDNVDFKIENTKMKIHPGPATAVRFFVQYNPLNKAPKLQAIRLNGREICNANNPLPAVDRPDSLDRPEDRRTTSRPRPDIRPEDMPQSKPVQGQPAGTGPVYSSTPGPLQNAVNLNIGGGQIPAQSVGTQTRPASSYDTHSGSGTGTGTSSSFGTQSGTGSSFGTQTGTGSTLNNDRRRPESGTGSSFGTQTGTSSTLNDDRRRPDSGTGSSFSTQTGTGNTFNDDRRRPDSGTGSSFGTTTGTGSTFNDDRRRPESGTSSSFGTQSGTGSSFGTQTGTGSTINDERRRPDNGYRLTTAVPMRTTTRYDDDDDSGNDYFAGGQPTFIVPAKPNNNNNRQAECGKVVRNNPNPLVVNGRPTLEGQWPWQIALYQTQTVDNKYICGGTLVTRSHVITAAHCVTRKGSSRVVNQNTLTVYLGKHNLRTSVEGVQIKLVSEIRAHPQYNASSYSKDVSVLKLRERVSYTDWVRPACLWPDNEVDLTNVIGKKGSVVGWGFDDKGVATEELTLVEMPVVDQETCIRSYSEFFARFTSDYTYCAGYKDGSSVCNGDSGGGMVFLMRNSWYLRGLVSLSVARHNEYRCDPTHYVVFTDLAKFLPWIQQNISDE